MKWVLIAIAVVASAAIVVTVIGFLLPRDHVASSTVLVPAPPSAVYGAITDIRGLPTWRSELSSVEVLATEPLRWREMSRFGPITFEQVKATPPSHFESRIADTTLAFGGSWSYALAAEGAGTRVTLTEHGVVYNPFFRFMSRIVLGHHRTQFSYLRALGRRFGADVTPARI
jgi:hypothetical protein